MGEPATTDALLVKWGHANVFHMSMRAAGAAWTLRHIDPKSKSITHAKWVSPDSMSAHGDTKGENYSLSIPVKQVYLS